MRVRSARFARRFSVLAVLLLAFTVAVPPGVVPANSHLPLAWIWSWLRTDPAAAESTPPDGPAQSHGPGDSAHDVPTSATRASGGTGRATNQVKILPKGLQDLLARNNTRASAVKKGYDPSTSTKVASLSTANSDVYANTDGSRTRRMYGTTVNYQAADKSWRPIDTSLVRRSDGQLDMAANSVHLALAGQGSSFAAGATGLATVTLAGGQTVSYGLAGAAPAEPVVAGSQATYPNVFPGVDLQLTATEAGVKDTLVLRSADAPTSYLYPLRLNGLTAALTADGSISLTTAAGVVAGWIPKASMVDSILDPLSGEGAHSAGASYTLVQTSTGQAVRLDLDSVWLHDPGRVFPVLVDPAVSGTSGDVYVDNDSSTTASDQNGNNLAVGTYNGGTVKSRAFLQFNTFNADLAGYRVTGAHLNLFLTWAYSCSTYRPFFVSPVTSAWDVATLAGKSLSDPGVPGFGAAIGSYTDTSPGSACTNTGGDRSVGHWDVVSLDQATFNNWITTPSTNYGLAITASESDSYGWKRFDAANYSAGSHKAYLTLDYSALLPQVNAQYPASGYQADTLQPQLTAAASDPDNFPQPLKYTFTVYDSDANVVASSGALSTSTWTVPAGKLQWGKPYAWTVAANDGSADSTTQTTNLFTTTVPQPSVTAGLAQNGDQGFDPSSGNYTMSATDATIATVGPSLSIDRAYNSDDPRGSDAFGAGWSSVVDLKATEQLDTDGTTVKTVVITYPTGQDVAFGRNPDGSFAAPQGRYATFTAVTGGYQLVDKNGTTYLFTHSTGVARQYGITSVTDAQGRAETFTFTAGQLTDTVSPSGRALHLAWSTPSGATAPHVATVKTDPAVAGDQSSVETWQYFYAGDLLTKVCPPTDSVHCTVYNYATTSPYARAVDNVGATNYWRLGEPAGATVAKDTVLTNEGANDGTYTGVTTGAAGFLPGSAATTATFPGSNSSVKVKPTLPMGAGSQTLSLWFKTTTAGGVLLGQSADPIATSPTFNEYQPVLYVGTDGKLYGQYATAPPQGQALGALLGAGSGRCMDVSGPSNANGTAIQLWDCNGGSNQQWTYSSAGELKVSIGGVTKCVGGSSTANGTQMVIWTCDGSDNQKWAATSDGEFVEVSSHKCLDATGYGTTNGTKIQIYDCQSTRTSNQVFFGTNHQTIASGSTTVTDGAWHNAVLTSTGTQQALFIDGTKVGTLAAPNGDAGQQNMYIGAGFLGGNWPAQSHTSTVNASGYPSFFTGSIAEVSAYDRPLTPTEISSLYSAGRTSTRPLTSLVRPSGNTSTTVTYDQVSGAVTSVVDANGGTWRIDPQTYSGSSQVYASSVLAGQPVDYWRLGDPTATNPVNQVHGGQATYANVTAAATADQLFSDAAGAAFDGSSSRISLPAADIATNGTLTAGLWFKTTNQGVLLDAAASQLGNGTCPCAPILWVAPDGTLRGLAPSATPTGQVYSHPLNKCLDDANGSATNGTKIQVWGCNSNAQQTFQLMADGTVHIMGKCLDAAGYGTANGTKIQLWDCGGGTNQQWVPFDGGLRNPVSGRCLDDPNSSTVNGTQLQLYDCNGGNAQLWFQSLSSGATVTDGKWHYATLTASGSTQALYLDGNVVQQNTSSPSSLPTQPFAYVGAGDTGTSWSGLPATSTSYFAGTIGEVALYRSALDARTIAAQFTARTRSSGAAVRVTTVHDPGDKPITHTFDMASRQQIAETDSRGYTTQYGYDLHGFLVSVVDPNGNMTATVHDARGNVVQSTTCQNQAQNKCSTVYYTYFPDDSSDPYQTNPTPPADVRNDLLLSVRDGRSSGPTDNTYKTTYGYDAAGNRTTVTDPLNRASTTFYSATGDANNTLPGLPVKAVSAGNSVQTVSYYPSGDIKETVDPLGKKTSYIYDGLGRVTSRKVTTDTFPDGLSTTFLYDALNRQVTSTAPPFTDRVTGAIHTSKSTTTYDYDSLVVAESIEDTSGGDATRTISTVFNSYGLPDTTTDAVGKVTKFEYDNYGNVKRETDADTQIIDSTFDSEGHLLTSVLRNYTGGDPNNQQQPTDLTLTTKHYDPAGRLGSETDAMNWTTSYTYTDNNLLSTISRSDGINGHQPFVQRSNVYDAAGNIIKQYTNNNATETDYTIDAANRTMSMTLDPAGVNRITSYTYGPDDVVSRTVRKDGQGTVVADSEATYDAAGNALTNTVHTGTADLITQYTRDKAGYITALKDPNGNTTNYELDAAGRTTVATLPAVTTERGTGDTPLTTRPVTYIGYNTFGDRVETKDANGNVTTIGYDAASRQVSTTLPPYTPPGSSTPVTPTTNRTYTPLGQLQTSADRLGKVTTYSYDQLGHVSKIVAPVGGSTTATTMFSYDELGDQLSMTDPTGAISQSTWDYLGRKVTDTVQVRPTGQNGQTAQTDTTNFFYDTPGGWLSKVVTPDGVNTTTDYNNLGEPVTATDGVHQVTTSSYDAAGRVWKTTLPDQSYTTVTYDLAGRATGTATYKPTGGAPVKTASTMYDPNGNTLTSQDGRNTVTTFVYDAVNRLVSQTEPISGTDAITSTFGYDAAGNQTRFTDGRGNAFYTTYNTWGLQESEILPATSAYPNLADRTFTTTYDQAGRPATATAPGGVSTTNTFDDAGRLTAQTGTGAEVASANRSFGYDAAGRLTSASAPGGTETFTYDDRSLLTSMAGPAGTASYTYTGNGELAARNDAAGTTNFTYDGAGRVQTVTNPTAGVSLTYAAYNPLNQPTQITYGVGGDTRWLGYDDLHRLASDEVKNASGTSLGKITYGYDPNGNETSKTTSGFLGATSNTYTYDLADRLTTWYNGTSTVTYGYDKSGNRIQVGSRLFTYDARNQLTTDGSKTYTYTPRGTLAGTTTGGVTLSTKTDAYGQVVAQDSAPGTTQTYNYDALGRLIRTGFAYTDTGNNLASDPTASYVRNADGALIGLRSGSTNRQVWTDLHTDVVGQFDATGATLTGSTSYDPLGRVLATAAMLGSLGYQSGWTDTTTGRVNMLARWYNTDTGQFDTKDTYQISPTPDSVSANDYAYGDDNPLIATDPTGHCWICGKIKSAVKSVASTVNTVVTTAISYVAIVSPSAASWLTAGWNTFKTAVTAVVHEVAKIAADPRKYIADKVAKAKKYVKDKIHAAVQGGKKIVSDQERKAAKVVGDIKDAYNDVKDFAKQHENDIISTGVGIAVDVICAAVVSAATGGAGAVLAPTLCGALSGAISSVVGKFLSCQDKSKQHAAGECDVEAFLKAALVGAIGGAVGGVTGALGGKLASAIIGKGLGLLGRIGVGSIAGAITGALSGGVAGAATSAVQYGLSCDKDCNWHDAGNAALGGAEQGALAGAVGGAVGGGLGGIKPPKAKPTPAAEADETGASPAKLTERDQEPATGGTACTRHSFAPDTKVLMADATVRPIKDINIGDKVTSTDPATGLTVAEPVTMLHINHDNDLVDVTLTLIATNPHSGPAPPAEKTVSLHTTARHPFWDQTTKSWVDASQLTPGHQLLTDDGVTAVIAGVHEVVGTQQMHDLTVNNIHTYYVLAGQTPVLVHNCNNVISNAEGHNNGPTLERHGEGTAFSGVYETESGAFRAQRSVQQRTTGHEPNVVNRNGGHNEINFSHFESSRSTVGFTAFREGDGFTVEWESGLNGRNFGDRSAPQMHRDSVMAALADATGLPVISR